VVLLLFIIMRRREQSRRGSSKILASDDNSAAGSSVGSMKIADAVGMMGKSNEDPWRKRSVVATSPSSPLNVTASTADVSMSFDTRSFNSSNIEIGKSPVIVSSRSTPINKDRFDVNFDDDDHSSMKDNMIPHKYETFLQVQTNVIASGVSPVEWTSTPNKSWTPTPSGWTPEKDQKPDIDWDPFDDDNNNGLAAAITSWRPFADKVEVGVLKVGALVSPVGVNDIDSFTRKRFNETKTSQSSSVNISSVHDDVLRSLRDENKRLKNGIKEISEEEGTLDTAAGTLFNDSRREDADDEGRIDEGTLTTNCDALNEGTADEGTLDEGTLATSFYESTIATGTSTDHVYTLDEGTVSYYSGSEADWDDMTLESDFDSSFTLESATSPRKPKRKNARNVMDAGPSSRTLRHALRHQTKSGAVTSTCLPMFEQWMVTYEDTNNAFSQVFNAFVVSLDDVDKLSDVIRDVKEDLKMSHTDKFVHK
jgi:hypothetical protein